MKKRIYVIATLCLAVLCIVAYITKNAPADSAALDEKASGEAVNYEDIPSQYTEVHTVIMNKSPYDILSVLNNDYDISDVRALLGRDNNKTWILDDGNELTYYDDNSIAYTFYDGYASIADEKMTFKDYTLAVIECESGTLTLELLQQLLTCKGCMTRRCNEGYTYTFSQAENKAVVADFDVFGNCTGLYRIY